MDVPYYRSAEYKRKWREKNKERINKESQARRLNDCEYWISTALIRRKSSCPDVPFDVTVEDLLPMPLVCPILGIPIYQTPNKTTDNSPSIDKIIVEKGYTKGNTIIVSYLANRLKNDGSLEQFQAIVKFLKAHKNSL